MISRAVMYVGAAAVLAAVIFGAGWVTRGWRDASNREGELRVQAQAQALEDQRRQGIAVTYTQQLTVVEANYAALPEWWTWFVAERPALDGVDIGPVGLCIWSAWNAATSPESCLSGQGAIDLAAPTEREVRGSDGEP